MAPDTLTKPKEPTGERHPQEQCVHYWVIEPPTQLTSKGVCKICGAERDFDNYVSFERGERP